jgi:hypothetical protein
VNAVRRVAAVLSIALSLLLTGCSGIPDTGPVIDGKRLDAPIQDPPIRVVPQGPFAGATQEQIALGFLRAAEDIDETRATAKLFLAPSSVDLWRGASEDVVIYDSPDDLAVRAVGPDQLELRARVVATVSPEGRYSEQPTGTEVSVTFGMTKVDGEWRIELPRTGFGLWLESGGFDRLYSAQKVYYVTQTGRQLVPDTRWIRSGSRMATTLARAQLAPPPPYLAGALTTGIPANTTLAVNAVPVENGRAQVTLSEQALEADPQERTAMWAQLAATLSQVPAVQSVSIKAGGTELELPALGTDVSVFADLGYEQTSTPSFETALLRAPGDGRITRIYPRFIPDVSANKRPPNTAEREGDPATIHPGWVSLAMSVDGVEVAAVGDDGADLARWRGAAFFPVKSFASHLTRPVYDSKGYLWVGGQDRGGNGHLYAMDAGEATGAEVPETIDAPWLRERKVVALAVAADAARMLVISSDRQGGDVRLGMVGIVRSTTGAPTSVGEPLGLGEPLRRMNDVAWLDENSFALIGGLGQKDPLRTWVGKVGEGLTGIRRHSPLTAEEARVAPLPQGTPVSVTSVGGSRGLIVISDANVVWVRTGAAWHEIGAGTDVVVPGR